MKKIILSIFVFSFISFAFADTITNNLESPSLISSDKITLINDTKEKVKVHTGSGSVSLNPRGGKTSFSCNKGKSVKVDGKVIFKISADHCGKTIKLSEYL